MTVQAPVVDISRTAASSTLDDPQLAPDLRAARAALAEQTQIVARPRDERTIAGHALIKDVYGKPAFILSVDVPRHVYAQGRVSLVYLTVSLFVVGLTFALVALLLVERFVLSRLRQLSSAVTRIGTAGDLSARITLPGGDELTSLATSVNWMLEGLEASRVRLAESEARLRSIVEHSTNLFYSRGTDDVLTYVSPQVRMFLDCQPEEALVGLVAQQVHHGLAFLDRHEAVTVGQLQLGLVAQLDGGRTLAHRVRGGLPDGLFGAWGGPGLLLGLAAVRKRLKRMPSRG